VAIGTDASTPTAVSQPSGTTAALLSNSFSPPAGAVVAVSWQGNSQNAAPTAPTISNTGGLTFTQINYRSKNDAAGANGQAAMWYATISSAPGPMTVTVANNATSGNRHARLRVKVLSGVDTASPIASSGEGTDSSGGLDGLSYVSAVANSVGIASVSDWDVSSSTFTAAAGTTIDDSASVASSVNCATLQQTTPTTSGATITLGLTAPTSTQWNYVWAEFRAAVGITPTPSAVAAAGSVPAPAVLTSSLVTVTTVSRSAAIPGPTVNTTGVAPGALVQATTTIPVRAVVPAGRRRRLAGSDGLGRFDRVRHGNAGPVCHLW